MKRKITIDELKNNLGDVLISMGITTKFKDNPAFEIIQNKIKSTLNGISNHTAFIEENDNNIKFEINQNGIINKEFKLIKLSENNFSFSEKSTQKLGSNVAGTALNAEYKMINNIIATLDENQRIITIERVASIRNDNVSNYHNSVVTPSIKTTQYNEYGIEMSREQKQFNSKEIPAKPNEIGEGICFANINQNPNYVEYSKIERTGFDTVKALHINKESNTKYSAVNQLSTEHLQHIHIPGTAFLPEVKINQMPKYEIEEIINKETNPKIKEGLRKLSEGREFYSYNSELDPDFIYETGSDSKTR